MFEAFKVGVKVSLVNEVSAGLLLMSRQFSGLNKQAVLLETQLKRIKMLGMVGGAMTGLGFMGIGMLDKMVKPASEYAHQLQLMNVSGMKHVEIVKAVNAAWNASNSVPTSSVTENLAAIRELRMVFRNSEDAIRYMPAVQKIQAVLSNLYGTDAGSQAYTVAKALELKGAVKDPADFMNQANMMTKSFVASGGKVTPQDYQSNFIYGKLAAQSWSDGFAYTILPTLMQEMKGSSGGGARGPGNALQSAYAAVVGGTISQKSLALYEKLGLLDPSKIVWNKVGSAKGVLPGGVKGSAEFQKDPYQWAQDYVKPALLKAGYKTDDQQKAALQYLFTNRTAGFIMGQFVTQPWKFKGDQKLIAESSGLEVYNKLLQNDPMMAKMALQKQWENLLAILGYQIMPQLIEGMKWLINTFRDMAFFFKQHAFLAKLLVGGFASLSIAMAIGGPILLLTFAFRMLAFALGGSLISAAITGIGAAAIGVLPALGALAMLIGTLAVAYKVSTDLGGGKLGNYLGGKIFDLTHPDPYHGYNPTASSKPIIVNMDGKKVANIVSIHQANAASSVPNLSTRFDTSMSPSPVITSRFGNI